MTHKRKNLATELDAKHQSSLEKQARASSIYDAEWEAQLNAHDSSHFDTKKHYTPLQPYERKSACYHTHPALKMPGTEIVIYGGSCISPAVADADVYVGLDGGMAVTSRSWPWKKGVEFLFKIQDMGTPTHPEEFVKLIAYLKKRLEAGDKIHVGCIGGHGRTGMVLSALVSLFGEPDAITYVRKNYCPKVVESTAQVKFLHDHFGVTQVTGSKTSVNSPVSKGKGQWGFGDSSSPKKNPSGSRELFPLSTPNSIWQYPKPRKIL